MQFSDLYNFSRSVEGALISVRRLADYVQANHPDIGEVNFWPVTLAEEITRGYVVYDYDRSSAYGDEYKILGIRYSNQLNRCWRRFVICKELMHAYDTEAQRTNSRDKYEILMRQLESLPRSDDFSEMLESEYDAEWMALLVLCPKPTRDQLKTRWLAKELTDLDVALEIRVPEAVVSSLMSDYYDAVHADLIGD